jgi:hypothetical protein
VCCLLLAPLAHLDKAGESNKAASTAARIPCNLVQASLVARPFAGLHAPGSLAITTAPSAPAASSPPAAPGSHTSCQLYSALIKLFLMRNALHTSAEPGMATARWLTSMVHVRPERRGSGGHTGSSCCCCCCCWLGTSWLACCCLESLLSLSLCLVSFLVLLLSAVLRDGCCCVCGCSCSSVSSLAGHAPDAVGSSTAGGGAGAAGAAGSSDWTEGLLLLLKLTLGTGSGSVEVMKGLGGGLLLLLLLCVAAGKPKNAAQQACQRFHQDTMSNMAVFAAAVIEVHVRYSCTQC